jgi:hypothetical protein
VEVWLGKWRHKSARCREHARRRSMSLEGNKALCNRGAEAISRGDFDAIDEIYAPIIPRSSKKCSPRYAEPSRTFMARTSSR